MTPLDRLRDREDLKKPISSRAVQLNWLLANLSQKQFEKVMSALLDGDMISQSYNSWLTLDEPIRRNNNKKHGLATEDWRNFTVNYPESPDDFQGVYLVDNVLEMSFTEISLNSSHVNRLLSLTGQDGGQPPKMGPKVYAFLAAWHFKADLPTDPEVIFAILCEKDLWENGEIEAARGVPAVASFIDFLQEFKSLEFSEDSL